MTLPEAELVVAAVAGRHGMSVEKLRSQNRTRYVCAAKAEACRELVSQGMSSPEVAKAVGYRNHTSVLHWTVLDGRDRLRDYNRERERCLASRIGYGL